MKIDMHVHSDKSPDALASVEELVAAAKRKGLGGIALCDHNYFHSEKKKFKDFIVIYGCEVSSTRGHMAVLGVDRVPTRETEKLAEWVKGEGGIAIPTHPFSLHKKGMGSIAFKVGTCVEKYNGTDPVNNLISRFRTKNGTGGSDAHHPAELGLAWTEFEGVETEKDVFEALRKGKFKAGVSLNPLAMPLAYSRRAWGRLSSGKPLVPKI